MFLVLLFLARSLIVVEGLFTYELNNFNEASVVKFSGDSISLIINSYIEYNNTNYTVISINESVFAMKRQLADVIFPPTLINIYNNAFEKCNQIREITFPDSVVFIGEKCFSNCVNLCNITFSRNLQIIGSKAFFQCVSITYIDLPQSLTSIGERAFSECHIQNLTIPKHVDSIGSNICYGCGLFTQFFVDIDNINFSSNQEGMLLSKDKSIIFDYPYGIKNKTAFIPEGIKKISPLCFYGRNSIQNIDFPTTLKVIDKYAFQNCANIKMLTFPKKINIIGSKSFDEITGISSINFNHCEEEIEIQDEAFAKVDSYFSEFRISSKIKSIGSKSFGKLGANKLIIENCSTSIKLNSFDISKISCFESPTECADSLLNSSLEMCREPEPTPKSLSLKSIFLISIVVTAFLSLVITIAITYYQNCRKNEMSAYSFGSLNEPLGKNTI